MSTENVEVFNRYYGNGVATQFSIGFPYLKREFVKVYLYKKDTDEEKVLNSDQFSFVNDATIQYPVLPTDEILKEGDILTIQRETALGSEFEFDNQRRLFPVEVMNADDLAFQQIQELSREIKRAVRVNPTAAQQPEELLTEVYDKLDSATEVANEAIAAATQATTAAGEATQAVERANSQIAETQEYIDNAKTDIDATVDAAKQDINTTVDEASMRLSDTIEQAVEDVKTEAVAAAEGAIQDAAATATGIVVEYANNEIKPELIGYRDSADEDARNASESARIARVWATGEDNEVHEIEADEHSSRGYADLAMAIANTPEDVPVDTSKLLALEVLQGLKGDKGEKGDKGDKGDTPDLSNYATKTDLDTKQNRLDATGTSKVPVYCDGYILKEVTALKAELVSGGFTKEIYYAHHPEMSEMHILPFIYNDFAFIDQKGGSYTVARNDGGEIGNPQNIFDAAPSFMHSRGFTSDTVWTVDIATPTNFTYGTLLYIDFCTPGFTCSHIKIEAQHSTTGAWQTVLEKTDNTSSYVYCRCSSDDYGVNKFKFTFKNPANNTQFRISSIGAISYKSAGIEETVLTRKGGTVFGDVIAPNITKLQNEVNELKSTLSSLQQALANQ